MYLTSAEEYKNADVHVLRVRNTGKIWVSMKDVHDGLGVKNISDLVLKEIHGKYEKKPLTNKQIRKYKMTETEDFGKYDNLNENELNKKSNKKVSVKNKIMTIVIVRCIGDNKIGHRKIGKFRKKLMIPKSEISQCLEHIIKSKLGKLFVNEKILEEYCVKIYEVNL